MEPRQEPPARTLRRAALVLLALVGLLGVVAIGSAGRTRVDLGGRRPSYVIVDTVVSLLLVALVLGAVAWLYVMVSQRDYLVAQRRAKGTRRRVVGAVIALLLVSSLLAVRGVLHHHGAERRPRPTPPNAAGEGAPATERVYRPRFATTPVLVLGVAASAALAAYLAYRPRRRTLGAPADEASLALTLANLLGDTLDDLRAEPDPRRAVIAAYARLERTLGAAGLPRRAAEAPDEYVHRIFLDLEVNSRAARKLTQLFAQAKFSQHDVDPAMKEEAIRLLETIRTGLREADARSRAEQESSKTTPPRVAW